MRLLDFRRFSGTVNRELTLRDTGDIISLITDDILREGAGEFVDSIDARKAIGKKAAKLYQVFLKAGGVK